MTTPIQRISRLLDEGARFMVELPGQTSIDLTPDVIAAMDEIQVGKRQLLVHQLTRSREHGEKTSPGKGSGNRAAACR